MINELLPLVESFAIYCKVSVQSAVRNQLPEMGTYCIITTVSPLPLSYNSVICPGVEEVIWPHISGGFKILFLWNPRIGLISWRVTPDMPMEREIESLDVKKKKKKNLFSSHFSAAKNIRVLPVYWHCIGISFPKQLSETNLYTLDNVSHFTLS